MDKKQLKEKLIEVRAKNQALKELNEENAIDFEVAEKDYNRLAQENEDLKRELKQSKEYYLQKTKQGEENRTIFDILDSVK